MRYTIEIDTKSKKEVLNHLSKVKDTKVIAIHPFRKLQSKDVALPGGIMPSEAEWEEYLDRKQGRGKRGAKAFRDIKKRLRDKHGK